MLDNGGLIPGRARPSDCKTLHPYDRVIEPLLRFLGEQSEPVSTGEAYRALAERLHLFEDEQQQLLPSRQQPVYHNRIGWAHDRLKRAGLSSSPRRSLSCSGTSGVSYLDG
jgi:restriction system protein